LFHGAAEEEEAKEWLVAPPAAAGRGRDPKHDPKPEELTFRNSIKLPAKRCV